MIGFYENWTQVYGEKSWIKENMTHFSYIKRKQFERQRRMESAWSKSEFSINSQGTEHSHVMNESLKKMLSSHLPRTPCDKFVYDFPCGFWGIVGGYGLRRMCSHCLRASCDILYGPSGASRGKSVQRLRGDCTEIVQSQWSCRAVSAASRR